MHLKLSRRVTQRLVVDTKEVDEIPHIYFRQVRFALYLPFQLIFPLWLLILHGDALVLLGVAKAKS
ncbi:hypothetical protein ES703_32537 [subsurface metagenome]